MVRWEATHDTTLDLSQMAKSGEEERKGAEWARRWEGLYSAGCDLAARPDHRRLLADGAWREGVLEWEGGGSVHGGWRQAVAERERSTWVSGGGREVTLE